MSDNVGWPRVERNARGEALWNQGPIGGIQTMLVMVPLPREWPKHWPEPPLSYDTVVRLLGYGR